MVRTQITIKNLISIFGIGKAEAVYLYNLYKGVKEGSRSLRSFMTKADQIIGGSGIEYLQSEWYAKNRGGPFHNPFFGEYVNTGETYRPTIIRDYRSESLFIESWGSFYERTYYNKDQEC